MLTDPTKMVFENTNDVIDYVSKGMVPTRKNFEKVMFAVRYPTPEGATPEEGQVRIPDRIFINCDNDTMNEALHRVYQNRVRNRNIGIGIVGVIAAGLIFGKLSNKYKDDDDDNIDSVGMNIDLEKYM